MIAAIDIGIKNFAFCIMNNERQIVEWKNLDVSEGKKRLNDTILRTVIQRLDECKDVFDECSVILIEKQMQFRGKFNVMAMTLAQHCYTYFLMRYPDKKIINYPAFHKTKTFDAPKKMTKYRRKKWAVEKARECIQDSSFLPFFTESKKQDDLADTYLMCLSYKIRNE